jgi:uroporphyrinogen-III synthase
VTVDEGFAAALLRHRTPIANVSFSGFRGFRDWPNNPGVSFVAVPLLWRSSLLGAIVLEHSRPRSYKENELRLLSSVGYILGAELRMLQLQKRNSELVLELETRKLVERGKGILQRDLGISAQEAFQALQRQSEKKKRPLKEIAQAIILNSEVRQNAASQAH